MKKVPSNVVKQRSRELTAVFESFTPYTGMEGKVERMWITDIASDGVHLKKLVPVQKSKNLALQHLVAAVKVPPTQEATTLLKNDPKRDNHSSRNLIEWFLRNRKNHSSKKMDLTSSESKEKQIQDLGRQIAWSPVDIALLSGILLSLFTIVALFFNLGSRSLSSK
ncbi:hypothetical protein RND71_039634 [Anisodus tanguticus]|uniref:Uncharacterized protein n=1 Tax=Anisodus tanguticus TaxID=243964 RepID=A0AAE1QXR6_9SOLA|nr:hypothetical protein RND71_039634 [Anisodus tanguticus]